MHIEHAHYDTSVFSDVHIKQNHNQVSVSDNHDTIFTVQCICILTREVEENRNTDQDGELHGC